MVRQFFALWFIILLLTACAEVVPINAPSTLKIGLVAPFEGLHRPMGYEALFAVKLALQERNAAGGLKGYRVELVALNDFDDPLEASRQARALAADPEVLGVVGHLSSATTLAALPVYQAANLAVSIPWSVADGSKPQPDGVVSVAANVEETAVRLETFEQAQGFKNMVKLTGKNLSPVSGNTQAVVLATEGVAAGETVVALRQANRSLPLLGQVETGSPQLVQVAGKAANGLVFVSPGPDPQHLAGAEAEAFRRSYQALAGFPPGPRAVLAYDAAQVLLDGIERSLRINQQQPTRAEVSAALNSVQRQGLSGNLAFDRQGRRIEAPVWLFQVDAETYPGILLSP